MAMEDLGANQEQLMEEIRQIQQEDEHEADILVPLEIPTAPRKSNKFRRIARPKPQPQQQQQKQPSGGLIRPQFFVRNPTYRCLFPPTIPGAPQKSKSKELKQMKAQHRELKKRVIRYLLSPADFMEEENSPN